MYSEVCTIVLIGSAIAVHQAWKSRDAPLDLDDDRGGIQARTAERCKELERDRAHLTTRVKTLETLLDKRKPRAK